MAQPTNSKLLEAIGTINTHLGSMDKRLDGMDRKFAHLEGKLLEIQTSMDRRFTQVEGKLLDLHNDLLGLKQRPPHSARELAL